MYNQIGLPPTSSEANCRKFDSRPMATKASANHHPRSPFVTLRISLTCSCPRVGTRRNERSNEAAKAKTARNP